MKTLLKLFTLTVALTALSACTPTDTAPPALLGSPDAPILIEEFSDFECPACAQVSPQLEDVVKRNADKVRMEYHHYPLPYHKYAFKAAEASECANDQDKFWEYSAALFRNQKNLTQDNLIKLATNLKLDEATFTECLNSGKKAGDVKSDLYEGRRRQVSYTPSIFVNGEIVKFTTPEQFEGFLNSL